MVDDPSANADKPLALSQLGRDRQATLRALALPHHRINALLGAHRLTCRSSLRTRVPGQPEQNIEQQLELRVNRQGHFSAVKTTHPHYGTEVVFKDDWLFVRQRASKFVKRRPHAGEPAAFADRLASLLPGYLELLERFIELKPGAVKNQRLTVRLAARAGTAPAAANVFPSRKWRQTISLEMLEGVAVLDTARGVPLEVELKARWKFSPPKAGSLPRSGIPGEVDPGKQGRATLVFSQKIEVMDAALVISTPALELVQGNLARQRIEIERQMLTGERPMPERDPRDPVRPQSRSLGAAP